MGESARSIYERAGEHHKDALKGEDDSHIHKHWVSCHGDAKPEFKIKLVATFQDALTRQIAEAVRIQMRGEGVLNSKAEYSRCSLPRLVIEKPDWEVLREIRQREDKETREAAEMITEKDEHDIMTKENGEHTILGGGLRNRKERI